MSETGDSPSTAAPAPVQSQNLRRMRSLDAMFLYMENANAPLHAGGLYLLSRPLESERLVRHVESRLPLAPRYKQCPVPVPLGLGHPTWEPAPHFNVRKHVVEHRLSRGANDAALAELCAKLFAAPLDLLRPPWELHLIQGYGDGCALLAKTHACMLGGVVGSALVDLLLDVSPGAKALPKSPPPGSSEGEGELTNPVLRAVDGMLGTAGKQFALLRRGVALLRGPGRALDEARAALDAVGTVAASMARGARGMPFNGELGRDRTMAWVRLSRNEVRALKSRLGGTVNDVLLAVICGGLRRYLRGRGTNVDGLELTAMVPSSRAPAAGPEAPGSRAATMLATLPVGIEDPLDQLRQVSATTDMLSRSGEAEHMARLATLADLLPPVALQALTRGQGAAPRVNTVCISVPGPAETRYLLGDVVDLVVPFVPLSAGVGLGFALLNYADRVTIGINADAKRVPDVRKLADALRQAFDALWSAAGLERVAAHAKVEPALHRRRRMEALSPRRVPAEKRTAKRAKPVKDTARN